MNIQDFFQSQFNTAPDAVAQAPGRLEFIGNHVDYNKGLVMGVAIDKHISVAVSLRNDDEIHMASAGLNAKGSVKLDDVRLQKGSQSFMNYPLGVFEMLRKAGMKVDRGFNLADVSTVPTGAGVSSSAAIELATAYALCKIYNFPMSKIEIVRTGQKAENVFVGMPCGILDQGVSGFGEKDAIVRIDCKTEEFSTLPIPAGTVFWVFNSMVKHALVAGDYAKRHASCMAAAAELGKYNDKIHCLADATPSAVEACRSKLSAEDYKRAMHVVCENARVVEMEHALAVGDLAAVGDLLKASHASSRDLFENSCPEIDFLVAELSAQPNVYGARLSGGGFGGISIALTNGDFSEAQAEKVAAAFEAKFGKRPSYFKTTIGTGAALIG
ncbi:MAG: galactokinase [Opitutales bacterium]|nr:galactokinase [Opitutales bacterium]